MNMDRTKPKSQVSFGSTSGRTVRLKAVQFIILVSMPLAIGAVPTALAQDGSKDKASAPARPLPKINPNGWTSPEVCGECHQAIHAVWRESMHAKAWSDPVFQAAYRRTIDDYGTSQSHVCLRCHAPTTWNEHESDKGNAAPSEGVTCDFCHSVKRVDLTDAANPFRLTLGKTKYGPLHHAQSPAHKIIQSELHTRSEFCASCHEYRNANGVTVLGTYSEWKNSSYARQGKQCQNCHMPLVPGRVVALDVKEDVGKRVNLHNISGSHNMDRVRNAVTLELAGYEWVGDRIWVYVKVANKGSGHCFPTGMPKHRAYLDVAIHDGGQVVDQRTIPFEIVLLNKDARPITREHELMVEAASVRRDTRLKPNEVRTINISFRDIKARHLTITADLHYEYSTETLVSDDTGEHIQPVTMSFVLASRKGSMNPDGF